MEQLKMFIEGKWTEGSEKKAFDVINPADGTVLARVYESNVEDTRRAVAAAKKSFYTTRKWRDTDSQTRGDILLKIADLMEEQAADLALGDVKLGDSQPYEAGLGHMLSMLSGSYMANAEQIRQSMLKQIEEGRNRTRREIIGDDMPDLPKV